VSTIGRVLSPAAFDRKNTITHSRLVRGAVDQYEHPYGRG
jgi:hypothetical protein